MKEFLKNDTISYNLMSFTGYKTLILFSLMTEGPKSYFDIKEYFENQPYVREKFSMDTMRVYMNSFKRVGCHIKRIREDGVSKYWITDNPFKLKLTQEQKKSVIKIYKTLVKNLAAEEIIELDRLLLKLTNYIADEEFVEEYHKASVLKKENLEIVDQLLDCCRAHKQITVAYNSPRSGIKDMEMITKRLVYNSNKLYVRASGLEYNQDTDFLVSRIVEIKEVKAPDENFESSKEVTVIYKLMTDGHVPDLIQNERLLEAGKDYAVISITGNNMFYINQRLLEHSSACTVLEPEQFKKAFVEQLKEMREEYDND